jgi:hypothetical protein
MMESLLSPNPLSPNQIILSEDEGTLVAKYNILWTCESGSNKFGSSNACRKLGDQGNYLTFKRYDVSSVAAASTITSTYIYRLFFHYGGGTAQFSCPASLNRANFLIRECLHRDRAMDEYGFKELSIRFMDSDSQLLDGNDNCMLAWLLERGQGHGDPRCLEGWAKKSEFSAQELANIRAYGGRHPFLGS